MKFRADSEALVLAALEAGPQHGYGIIRIMRDTSEGLFDINEGQLYPLLHKMQEKGWVVGEWYIQATGNPRKNYTLTETGQMELEKRRTEWSKFLSSVSNLILSSPVKRIEPEALHG